MAGNGLFTSGTRDPDWQTAHGILPRAFNALKIRVRARPHATLCACVPNSLDTSIAGSKHSSTFRSHKRGLCTPHGFDQNQLLSALDPGRTHI
jgi:hypothetical protein